MTGGVPTDKLCPVPTTPFQSQDICATLASKGPLLVDPEPTVEPGLEPALDAEPALPADPELAPPPDPEVVLPPDRPPLELEAAVEPELPPEPAPPLSVAPLPQLACPATIEPAPVARARAVSPNPRPTTRATPMRSLLEVPEDGTQGR